MVPYRGPTQDDYIGTDPDVLADMYLPCHKMALLLGPVIVIVVVDAYIRRYFGISPYRDLICAIDDAIVIDEYILTKPQFALVIYTQTRIFSDEDKGADIHLGFPVKNLDPTIHLHGEQRRLHMAQVEELEEQRPNDPDAVGPIHQEGEVDPPILALRHERAYHFFCDSNHRTRLLLGDSFSVYMFLIKNIWAKKMI